MGVTSFSQSFSLVFTYQLQITVTAMTIVSSRLHVFLCYKVCVYMMPLKREEAVGLEGREKPVHFNHASNQRHSARTPVTVHTPSHFHGPPRIIGIIALCRRVVGVYNKGWDVFYLHGH